jgi:hypothetical protein
LHVLYKDLVDTVIRGRYTCKSSYRYMIAHLASPCASARPHNTFPSHRSLPHFSYGLPAPSLTAFIISCRPSTCFFVPSSKTFHSFPAFITKELHKLLLLLSQPLNRIDFVYWMKRTTEACNNIELKTYMEDLYSCAFLKVKINSC